ncbi:zinc metalloprotease HtpX [Schaalia hyovaginalis]|uniref:Protease HtpX homolog n=2 Tax=Schaalia hyovaginalis TaxID=29316 RepID=A0A923E5Q8_9ACTO|nr:zinc metalloprotease HtpX [Schaalia hyovaginalis]MBB6334049.1 heat shock protein HtpX [Schaalia hyovaginalis]MCI7672367.1 zinc metalloprotease HtpX [Schaalia hyovaginalis]MDY5505890.1 zinc metalloprotease HtpX [Schaalia hyovaginalis]
MTHRGYRNGLKTAVLLGGLWALLAAVGWIIANSTGRSIWLWVFAALGLFQTAYAYWNSASMSLRAMNAYEVSEAQRPDLHRIVRELSDRAGQPMPSIWIAPTRTPNAFATGRDPEHAAVCCTEGILEILGERELRGVLGHELMHVYNRDILTSSVAAALGGLVTSIAQFLMFFGGGRNRDDEGGGVGVLAGIAIALLAPLAATLIQFSLSRTREFDADEDGATLTQDPLALASALRKLETVTDRAPLQPTPANQNVAAMMIANPFRGAGLRRLFSTHPPMDERIARLEKMAGY